MEYLDLNDSLRSLLVIAAMVTTVAIGGVDIQAKISRDHQVDDAARAGYCSNVGHNETLCGH